jgi:uncharacterized protein (DUF433 family)
MPAVEGTIAPAHNRRTMAAKAPPQDTSHRAGTAGSSRVVRDTAIQGGEPTIAGTRTTVRSIVLAAREIGHLAGVLHDFPHLSAEDVADALAYYERHRAEIEAVIAEFGDGDEPA